MALQDKAHDAHTAAAAAATFFFDYYRHGSAPLDYEQQRSPGPGFHGLWDVVKRRVCTTS